MNDLCKKLVIIAVAIGFLGLAYAVEKEAPRGLLQSTQRKAALSMIGDSLLNQQEPMTVKDKYALNWIKGDISIFQADLIARVYNATQAGDAFFIKSVNDFCSLCENDDMYIWMTLPEYVRDYLDDHLNIEFCW